MSGRRGGRARRFPRSPAEWLAGAVLYTLAGLSLVLLIGPSLIVVGISFTEKRYISFPPEGFTLRWYEAFLDHDQLIDSAFVSLRIAAWVTVLTLGLGVACAFSLVRGRYRWRTALSAFMVSPQMLPGMVIGIAVLFFGSAFGFYQSNPMVVIAMTVFCIPFVVRIVMARLEVMDPRHRGGVREPRRLPHPDLPPRHPPPDAAAALAAAAFAFIEAFDNLTVALFTASPRGRPLSVELYSLVQFDSSPIVAAISSLEILLALLMVFVIGRTIGLEKL